MHTLRSLFLCARPSQTMLNVASHSGLRTRTSSTNNVSQMDALCKAMQLYDLELEVLARLTNVDKFTKDEMTYLFVVIEHVTDKLDIDKLNADSIMTLISESNEFPMMEQIVYASVRQPNDSIALASSKQPNAEVIEKIKKAIAQSQQYKQSGGRSSNTVYAFGRQRRLYVKVRGDYRAIP